MQRLINNPLFKKVSLDKVNSKRYIAYKPNKGVPLTKQDLSLLINEPSFLAIEDGVILFYIKSI